MSRNKRRMRTNFENSKNTMSKTKRELKFACKKKEKNAVKRLMKSQRNMKNDFFLSNQNLMICLNEWKRILKDCIKKKVRYRQSSQTRKEF